MADLPHLAYMAQQKQAARCSQFSCRSSVCWTMLVLLLSTILRTPCASAEFPPVRLDASVPELLMISNGLVTITLSVHGYILELAYGPLENLLEEGQAKFRMGPRRANDRGYFSAHIFHEESGREDYRVVYCTSWEIIENSFDRVTLRFLQPADPEPHERPPFPANVYLLYSVSRGLSGFHSYVKLERTAGMPGGLISELRFVMKLGMEEFVSTVLADDRNRTMPSWDDVLPQRSEDTSIVEARRILDPRNPKVKYEVDHKYHYILANKDARVYGWTSNTKPQVGVWLINPNKEEYTAGGPTRQDLTVQTGGIMTNYFHSHHLGMPRLRLHQNRSWSKVYGPFPFY